MPDLACLSPRPINYGAVIAATIRETSRAEYERRIGAWRESMAIWVDHQTTEHDDKEAR